MNDYKRTPEALFEHTNGGLEIIHKYVPDSIGCEIHKNKKFKFRPAERTASATLHFDKNIWFVVDFGGESYTAIGLVQKLLGLDFSQTLKLLYDEFNLSEESTLFRPIINIHKNTKLAKNYFHIETKKIPQNLALVSRFLSDETAKEYHFYEVDFYEKVIVDKETQNLQLIKIQSTEQYPIFCYSPDLTKWAKIYCPKDKKYKHSYLGEKPATYIHGLDRILKNTNENKITQLRNAPKTDDEAQNELDGLLLKNIVICSGGSDGLSLASLSNDFFPIWFNSEGEQIQNEDYTRIQNLCKNLYNLPDIDISGKKYAYSLAKKYWNLRTIWLPQNKLTAKGKDFRDFINFYQNADRKTIENQFKKLVNVSLSCNFIDEKQGKTISYRINLANLHYFLNVHNYYTYNPQNKMIGRSNEDNSLLVHIDKFKVSLPTSNEIRKFCEDFVKQKGLPLDVVNLIKSSRVFTDTELKKIDKIELDFSNFDAISQVFFFQNRAIKTTKSGIKLLKDEEISNYVWNDKIIPRNFIPTKPFFEYYIDESGNDRIKILSYDCPFMLFLLNGSRVFWRKDLEDFTENVEKRKEYHDFNLFNLNGIHLTQKEQIIQEQHLLNKFYAIGYLLHRYKQEDFAKFVYIMDDTPKESDDEANGGTGKSLFIRGIKEMINVFLIDGKNEALKTDNHLFGGVSSDHDLIYIDDGSRYLDFTFFYSKITSSIIVNPKLKQGFEIPFEKSPKLAGTFNYGISRNSGSDLRRLLFVSFSDYYHAHTKDYYEERKPIHDFGKGFFQEWNEQEWNLFYNFMLQCLHFYLSHPDKEFHAPDDNITINNLRSSIGDSFIEWAETYFSDENLNTMISRQMMMFHYKDFVGNKSAKSPKSFKKALQNYCDLKGYILNPKELQRADGRIKKNDYNNYGQFTTVECFYVKSQ